jgi:hypothetical protein
VFLLECLQVPNQAVVLDIRDLGCIENVVKVVVVTDLLA